MDLAVMRGGLAKDNLDVGVMIFEPKDEHNAASNPSGSYTIYFIVTSDTVGVITHENDDLPQPNNADFHNTYNDENWDDIVATALIENGYVSSKNLGTMVSSENGKKEQLMKRLGEKTSVLSKATDLENAGMNAVTSIWGYIYGST
jgi:hypothetical protein